MRTGTKRIGPASAKMSNRKTRWHQSMPQRVEAKPGEVYGFLIVLGMSPHVGKLRCICLCVCGRTKSYAVLQLRFKAKHGKPSCGCMVGAKPLPHGQAALNHIHGRYKRQSKIKGRRFDLTIDDFRLVITQNCHYCGCEPRQVYRAVGGCFVYNGIDRVNSEWGYSFPNIVPCCFPCNKLKGDIPYVVFIRNIRKIYEFLKLGEVAKCSK